MTTDKQRTIAQFLALRASFETRLRANPDYVAIQEIDRSIERLSAITSEVAASVPTPIDNTLRVPPVTGILSRARTKVRQGEAAYKAILTAGIPLTIDEIVPAVEQSGAKLTGNKNINLSSALSRDESFVSVKWRGLNRWWLVGKPIPDEGLLLRVEAQTNSAPPAQAGEAVN
jgi:hypothetical protein